MAETKPSASLSSGLLARKGGAKPAMRRPSIAHSDAGIEAGQDDLGWNDMGYDVNPDPNAPSEHPVGSQPNPLAGAVPEATPEVKKQQEQIAARLQAQPETDYPKEAIGVPNAHSALPIGGLWMPEAEKSDEAEAPAPEAALAAEAETSDVPESEIPVGEAPEIEESQQNLAAEDHRVSAEAAPTVTATNESGKKQPVKKRAAAGSKAKSAFTLRLDRERHLKLRLACAVNNKSAQKMVTEALDQMLNEMPEIKTLAENISE